MLNIKKPSFGRVEENPTNLGDVNAGIFIGLRFQSLEGCKPLTNKPDFETREKALLAMNFTTSDLDLHNRFSANP